MKARLLAALILLVVVFVPINITKLILIESPALPYRILFNAAAAGVALISLRWVLAGRLERAGNFLVLGTVVIAHAIVCLAPRYAEPLALVVQVFAFDLAFLLLALVFATRAVAFLSLGIILAGHFALSSRLAGIGGMEGHVKFAADTLLRDGLAAIVFSFCIGLALIRMMEVAYRRSEESLRESRTLNENLERMVSERTRDLEAATRQAVEASGAKSNFLANMSHEIRTPLNGIVAAADLLLTDRDLAPGMVEHVQLISESGDLLVMLIDDILDFSKIEAGQLELEKHPFELLSVISNSVALMAANAVAAKVRLDFSVTRQLRGYFEGDSFRLRQILLNLLSNAIKFTPEGGKVRLTVRSADARADPALIRFEVSDTGIGMDESVKSRIFARFMQADASTTRRYGGTGLGLAISSHLVDLMGGRLDAESAVGKGSVFHFTVALRPVVPRADALDSMESEPAALGLRVLVAEDNAINRRIFRMQLEKLGCRPVMAANGEEALGALGQAPLPDVILMDCHMPGLDGWQATQRIRSWAGERDASPLQRKAAMLPIIALTAAALPEERTRCLSVGMNDFVAKPVKLADLSRALGPVAASLGPAE